MADRRLYYEDPELERLETRIVESGELEGRAFVRLEATILYPEGGGQPSDRGTIAGVETLEVRAVEEGRILHFVAAPLPVGPAEVRLDVARRRDHEQQHTAQHLLTAVLLDRHGWPTRSFHLGSSYTAIEIAAPVPSRDRLDAVEDEVNREIRRATPVTARWVEADELASLPVRTRGLPEGHRGPVRLVAIDGIDLNTCGGTHVRHLGEIQMIRILDAEPARGGARVRFLAGRRISSALREHAAIHAVLGARLGASPEAFPAVLDGWEAERRRLERRVRELESDLARRIARDWTAEASSRTCRFLPGSGPEFLTAVASAVVEARPSAVVAIVGGAGEACYVVQSGPEGPEEVGDLAERLRARLGAKGGGRGRLHQGRGGRLPVGDDVFDGLA